MPKKSDPASSEKSLLMCLAEAMHMLACGPSKIRELAARGVIERVALGARCVRYTRPSIEALARPRGERGPGRPRGGQS